MIKKLVILVLMFGYLYALAFNIFLNSYFRFPTPLLFGIPLIALFWQRNQRFLYVREALVLFALNFLFFVVAQQDTKSAAVNLLVIVVVFLYFNFFVGIDNKRFKSSIILFYLLLTMSTLIMLANHVYRPQIDSLRATLIGAEVGQSPAGISSTIFSFGYQLAALVSFLFIAAILFTRSWFIRIAVLMACLTAIYFGMQRSALITFAVTSLVFLLLYYRFKAVPIIGLVVIVSLAFSPFFITKSSGQYDNIFAKNERNAEQDRSALVTENLNIYSNYPLGLMFYGKNWNDVTKYNKIYAGGLTSHNAYLMFLTYVGPFVGITFLLLLYYKVGKIIKFVLTEIRDPKNALLVCLSLSFLAISLNSMFHNASLIGAEGASVFIYFAILHRYNMQYGTEIIVEEKVQVIQKPFKKNTRLLSYE